MQGPLLETSLGRFIDSGWVAGGSISPGCGQPAAQMLASPRTTRRSRSPKRSRVSNCCAAHGRRRAQPEQRASRRSSAKPSASPTSARGPPRHRGLRPDPERGRALRAPHARGHAARAAARDRPRRNQPRDARAPPRTAAARNREPLRLDRVDVPDRGVVVRGPAEDLEVLLLLVAHRLTGCRAAARRCASRSARTTPTRRVELDVVGSVRVDDRDAARSRRPPVRGKRCVAGAEGGTRRAATACVSKTLAAVTRDWSCRARVLEVSALPAPDSAADRAAFGERRDRDARGADGRGRAPARRAVRG